MKGFFIFCGLLVGLYLFWENSAISRAAGVLAPDEPHQREVYSASSREKNGYRITPLATFDIRARVIARERYRFGRAANLSPIDLVLGWGAMSDTEVLKKIRFSQGGRAYTWMTSVFPVPQHVIETHSANMHMIPADGDIERRLKSIRAGNMVHLKGFLVEVTAAEGWGWKSLSPAAIPAAALASLSWWRHSTSGERRPRHRCFEADQKSPHFRNTA